MKLFLKRQIKTCQDCDQLRPFTVKRTCPAKTRIKTDTIEFFFQEDSSMDLTSRMIWRFGHLIKLHPNSFSVKSQSVALHFAISQVFAEETKETYFSVKSSWEVNWIIMFQKDAVWYGEDLNSSPQKLIYCKMTLHRVKLCM